MFSSYPTTTLLPTRRAQTPPVSSLPTSPTDEVGRSQSLTSPDTQPSRNQNRTGTCECTTSLHRDTHTHTEPYYVHPGDCGDLYLASSLGPEQQTVDVPAPAPAPCHRGAPARDGLLPATDHQGSGGYWSEPPRCHSFIHNTVKNYDNCRFQEGNSQPPEFMSASSVHVVSGPICECHNKKSIQ